MMEEPLWLFFLYYSTHCVERMLLLQWECTDLYKNFYSVKSNIEEI